MNQKKFPVREMTFLVLGELLVGIIISLIYLLIDKFSYTVITGALLGGGVTILNFLFLSISVNRAVDNLMKNNDFSKVQENQEKSVQNDEEFAAENAEGEESESKENDEISKFAQENTPKLQNTLKISYIVRTLTMIAVLFLAALSKQFDLISTVIPLLMFRPLISLSEMTKRKGK